MSPLWEKGHDAAYCWRKRRLAEELRRTKSEQGQVIQERKRELQVTQTIQKTTLWPCTLWRLIEHETWFLDMELRDQKVQPRYLRRSHGILAAYSRREMLRVIVGRSSILEVEKIIAAGEESFEIQRR